MLNCRQIKRVAVTGALSAGKSSACRFFAECGAYVVSSDAIVHHLLEVPSKLTQQVVNLLGNEVVVENRLDRRLIAKLIFADDRLATALQQLLHPYVREALKSSYQVCVQECYPLFVAEVPLLYEVGWSQDFDVVVAVLADPDQCLKRFRNSFFPDNPNDASRAFLQRMARQMDPKEKASLADYVLMNQTTNEELGRAVQEIYAKLKAY